MHSNIWGGDIMKIRLGDRKDGTLIRDLDSLHFITGIIYPNRCDNEAYISERIDLTNIYAYLEKKNYEGIEYKYNVFQIINAAIIKMLTLRPKMNRFIVNGNFYQRNEITTSFVVKKLFDDNGGEALAFVHAKDSDTIDSIHQSIYEQVSFCRSDKVDSSTENMDILNKIPRPISKTAIHGIMLLDKHGWVPQSMIDTDPYYSSCVISNLGSIKLKSGYHHLTNWGTCSMILLIGEIKENDNGPYVDLGITIDERLVDGYYYSKSMRLFRKLLENPELLELPMSTKVDY